MHLWRAFVFGAVTFAIMMSAIAWDGALAQAVADRGGDTVWISTPLGRLKVQVYRYGASTHGPLIVVLHGDAPLNRPGYQYRFADSAARALPGATVAAILRPGYTDPAGDTSQGQRGMTTGDNYTPRVVDAVAEAIVQLAAREQSTRVTLVGHSGGAAIAAVIMERRKDLASRALLVSCPCDVEKWRAGMAWKHFNPLWRLPVGSLSPIAHTASLPRNGVLRVVVGANDSVTPPALSSAFADAARARVARVDLVVLPGLGHEILLRPEVLAALQELER
jgi:pimeloyl-ACP methyl ester carboxylesterase